MNISRFAKTLIVALCLSGGATSALAHETKCPYCKLDVVQDTKDLDNETVLRYGNKRIEYRCVLCALAQAKTRYKNDLTILAPSTKKGAPVKIERKGGAWSAPEGVLFVYQKGPHSKCETLYRAAMNKAEAEAWAKANGLTEARFLTLKEMVEFSK